MMKGGPVEPEADFQLYAEEIRQALAESTAMLDVAAK